MATALHRTLVLGQSESRQLAAEFVLFERTRGVLRHVETRILLDDGRWRDDRRKYQRAFRSGEQRARVNADHSSNAFQELKTNNRQRPRLEKTFQTTRNSNGILLQRGDNFGDFNFGSTIVLVFEAPDNLVFNFKSGEPIRLGQALCSLEQISSSPTQDESSEEIGSTDDDDEEDAPNKSTEENSLLIDTIALDAAIADADAIADREVLCKSDESFEQ